MNAILTSDDSAALLAALSWQIEAGVDECIGEEPVDRFQAAKEAPAPKTTKQSDPVVTRESVEPDGVTAARRAAAEAESLEALRAAMENFEGCALKGGAKNTVFADGSPAARVMFIGEAPGRDEDGKASLSSGVPGNCWIGCLPLSGWIVARMILKKPPISPMFCHGARWIIAILPPMKR